VLLLDDDDELPPPDAREAGLAAALGDDRLATIDSALIANTKKQWLKAARVVFDALEAGGFPKDNDHYVDLHVRRLIALVDSGKLEAQGNLRRPRFSEVRLPQ
jgi:hypothetical protein